MPDYYCYTLRINDAEYRSEMLRRGSEPVEYIMIFQEDREDDPLEVDHAFLKVVGTEESLEEDEVKFAEAMLEAYEGYIMSGAGDPDVAELLKQSNAMLDDLVANHKNRS